MNFLLEEKIKENLAFLKIETIDWYKRLSWLSLIICGALTWILLIVISLIDASYVGLPILILLPLGIILFLVFFVKTKRIRKRNLKKMAEANSLFHQLYFEFSGNLFPQGFQFDGIFSLENSNYHSLNFTFGAEQIVWQIKQALTLNSYIISYCLTTTAKKLAGFDSISISEQKEIHDLFKFESVEFTKRFKVEGNNSVQVYKLLSPKIMDNFLRQKNHFLEPKTIKIGDGVASIEWGGTKSSLSWVADPLDFSKVEWTKKRMVNGVYKKIAVDFARFLENQKLLEPLALYENE